MARRITSLNPGDIVQLRFANRDEIEPAVFVQLTGEGDEQRAMFVSVYSASRRQYVWEAYRYRGRWTAGTGADRVCLVG